MKPAMTINGVMIFERAEFYIFHIVLYMKTVSGTCDSQNFITKADIMKEKYTTCISVLSNNVYVVWALKRNVQLNEKQIRIRRGKTRIFFWKFWSKNIIILMKVSIISGSN